jgi:CHAT domain-containing protein
VSFVFNPANIVRIASFAAFSTALLGVGCTTFTTPLQNQKRSEKRLLRRKLRAIYPLYSQHKLTEAISAYLSAAEESIKQRDFESASKLLLNAGGCQLAIFRYQDAFGTMERARQAANRTGDRDVIAMANANIATLYLQMNNSSGAAQAADRALANLREGNPFFSAVIIPIAQVRAEQNDLAHAEPLLRRGIDAAYSAGTLNTAASAWDYLGYRYTLAHRLPEADRALTESLRLRKMFHLADLGSSYFHLAMLRSDEGQTKAATALLNSAVEEVQKPGNATPAWNIFFARGRLLAKTGDQAGAWANLGKAVQLARNWRAELVANDANRTSAETALADLYSLYIQVGNQFADSHNISLARETFDAAEENRATSLRALAERETGWHNKLPAQYWEALSQFQDAEELVLKEDSTQHRVDVARLRAQLDDYEAAAGMLKKLAVQSAASATQAKLNNNTVFLSFYLGEQKSWLWAVTRQDIRVYPLPSRAALTPQIRRFQECVRRGAPCAEDKGEVLYRELFSQLPEQFTSRERWLFSLDQELFGLPMAALVIRQGLKPVYLGATHALQATPGALIYARAVQAPEFRGPLLGVGDPIYNRADSRWRTDPLRARLGFVSKNDSVGDPTSSSFYFARLWGAADEVRAVANTWDASSSIVLTGEAASRQRLWSELARKPAVVHFATHILEADDQLHTGWIALSMGANGTPEFVSPAEISVRRLSASLVVLNGCSSGLGEVRAASGLMGLTRAWIAAGASDVLATRWPGPDENGSFFIEFYRSLKQFPEKGPSFALLSACRKSIAEKGWRAKPQFWASYFLTGTD